VKHGSQAVWSEATGFEDRRAACSGRRGIPRETRLSSGLERSDRIKAENGIALPQRAMST
jgi:hypothetical protein